MIFRALLLCLLPTFAHAQFTPPAPLAALPHATAANSIHLAAFANSPISSDSAGTGTYIGTAPSTSGWTGTWGGTSCTGPSTIVVNSVGGGNISITATTPASPCTGTLTVTDNLGSITTSPVVSIGFPGDIVPSASLWAGMRAYNSILATNGTTFAIQVTRVSDSVACDVLLTNRGALGLTVATCNGSTQGGLSPEAFAGTDASGSGSISGTTLTFTGGHVGDVVTGTGVSPGTYIVSGSSPTWTVYPSQTVVSTTLALSKALLCNRVYDQTIASNVGWSNIFNNVYFVPTGGSPSGKAPWCATDGTSGLNETMPGGNISQPVSISSVNFRRTGSTSAAIVQNGSSQAFTGFIYNSANHVEIYAGADLTQISATDAVWHAFHAIINGGSSTIMIDGSLSSISNPGAGSLGDSVGLNIVSGSSSGGTAGGGSEWGIWSGAISSANQTLIDANQQVGY
jgi:hypothetical protein